jgi:hypothetical protein
MSEILKYKKDIEDASVALLRDHGIRQSNIYEWVLNAMKAHVAQMPMVRVLYNNCHGGYGFSKEFMMFLNEKNNCLKEKLDESAFGNGSESSGADDTVSSNETSSECECDCEACCEEYYEHHRIKAVKDIVPFAKYILEKEEFKGLKDVLYMYHKYQFETVLKCATQIEQNEERIKNVTKHLQKLRDYLANPDSKFKASPHSDQLRNLYPYMLTFMEVDCEHYSRRELEDFLEEVRNKNPTTECKDTISVAKIQVSALVGETIMKEVLQYVKQETKKERKRVNNDSRKSFISQLTKHGWKSTEAWSTFYRSYNMSAMRFIIAKWKPGHDFVSGGSTQELEDEYYEKFGLLCASDTYACLDIKDVPALVEWKVTDYDGLEKVVVV